MFIYAEGVDYTVRAVGEAGSIGADGGRVGAGVELVPGGAVPAQHQRSRGAVALVVADGPALVAVGGDDVGQRNLPLQRHQSPGLAVGQILGRACKLADRLRRCRLRPADGETKAAAKILHPAPQLRLQDDGHGDQDGNGGEAQEQTKSGQRQQQVRQQHVPAVAVDRPEHPTRQHADVRRHVQLDRLGGPRDAPAPRGDDRDARARLGGNEEELDGLRRSIGGGIVLEQQNQIVPKLSFEVTETAAVGEQGTTFGGGPVACAAGNAVLDVIDDLPSYRYMADLPEWLGRAQSGLGL